MQIRLSKYQGRYAGIYIRKNNGKYVYIRMKNNKISPRRKTFNFRHSMRNVTLSVRVRTYQTKKRKKGSFYSKVKKVRIHDPYLLVNCGRIICYAQDISS
ncbi:hypothetical protein [Roseburia sp. AM59-24XD]|uniref:hypothetical protein n=1 Tax=Roseburia sp. AM59-24XD TaxID=2293138 RepID=UPI0011C39386|nr:hypothetical protein [Roseburia sp. AM59-24XD]